MLAAAELCGFERDRRSPWRYHLRGGYDEPLAIEVHVDDFQMAARTMEAASTFFEIWGAMREEGRSCPPRTAASGRGWPPGGAPAGRRDPQPNAGRLPTTGVEVRGKECKPGVARSRVTPTWVTGALPLHRTGESNRWYHGR